MIAYESLYKQIFGINFYLVNQVKLWYDYSTIEFAKVR